MKLAPWPSYSEEEINCVSDVLRDGSVNYWTGTQNTSFEKEFASWCNCSFAVSLANGSLALTTAYSALGLTSGDQVITTPRTFIATSSTAALLGAHPVFADVDPDSGCITAETIEPLITKHTKAIAVVHLGGWPADMHSICALAKTYGLHVIEDCSQAHGALFNNQSVGSFGDISVWSFCQDKIISTGGEGGMLTTSSGSLYKRAWSLKDHGKNPDLVTNVQDFSFRWLHDSFGSNFRLTEMQAAIGRIQLARMSSTTASRSRVASILFNILSDLPFIRIPYPDASLTHAWYRFYLYLDLSSMSSNWSRSRIISEISLHGFPAFQGTCSEIYLENCFKTSAYAQSERLPVARLLGDSSLALLTHHTITDDQATAYALCVRKILVKAFQ